MNPQINREHTEQYLKIYTDLEKSRSIGLWAHLRTLQENALQKFAEQGFPTTRNEEWKFTDVGIIRDLNVHLPAGPPQIQDEAEWIREHWIAAPRSRRLVFVDGHYHPGLSDPGKGTEIEMIPFSTIPSGRVKDFTSRIGQQILSMEDPFTALNTALFRDGIWIRIPKGKIIEDPVEIIYASTARPQAGLIQPRNLIEVHENSQVRIIENYIGHHEAVYFSNAVTEIRLESNAQVEHFKIQQESSRAFHIGTVQVQQDRNSHYTSHSFSFGGSLVRNNINAVLAEEGIERTLNGLYVGDEKQLIDNHTAIDHTRPHCNSHELYKGILDDSARGVFNGKIFVRPAAQKTNAIQSNNCILLTDEATINTKPQLEIFADDVKCTHGATVGQLDEEAYFYMRSRGLDETKARQMLIFAFAADVIDRISLDPVREKITGLLSGKLKSVHLD